MVLSRPGVKVKAKVAFKRLYFDGLAAGKYNVGFGTGTTKNANSFRDNFYYFPSPTLDFEELRSITRDFFRYLLGMPRLNERQTQEFIFNLLSLKVDLRNKSLNQDSFRLIDSGEEISRLYLYSTTQKQSLTLLKENAWWVEKGKPIIIIQCNTDEEFKLPFSGKEVSLPSQSALKLTHYFLPFQSYYLPIWVIQTNDHEFSKRRKNSLNLARTLRLYLSRLHVEHESLKTILRNIETDRIFITKGHVASEMLQKYLNEATRRISRYEKNCDQKFDTDEVSDWIKHSENTIYSGRKDSVMSLLDKMKIRKNIYRKVDKYLEKSQSNIIKQSGGILIMNSDSYYANQVGAQGNSARSDGNIFLNLSSQHEFSLEKLSEELSVLRAKLKDEAVNAEHDIYIGAIAQAESYAKQNNGAKALESLGNAGRWSLDAATKVGTTVAAKALSIALGLES